MASLASLGRETPRLPFEGPAKEGPAKGVSPCSPKIDTHALSSEPAGRSDTSHNEASPIIRQKLGCGIRGVNSRARSRNAL